MKLLCPQCSSAIPAADINVDTGIAKCSSCGEVINIFHALGLPTPANAPALATKTEHEIAPNPPRFKVEDRGIEGFTVRWRWFGLHHVFLIFWGAGWDTFLVYWYYQAFRGGAAGHMSLMAILFPIGHVAVGVTVTYLVVAGILNQTFLSLDQFQLTIRHAPIYWRGNRRLPIDQIQQLCCRRGQSQKDGTQPCDLWAILTDQRELRLVSLRTIGEARFLEQQIESRLGLEHHPIAGEYRCE